VKRHAEGVVKRGIAFAYYRILQHLTDVEIPADTGDFCLMDRRVVDLLNRMPERNRYLRGLRAWLGFRQTAVQFERPPRIAGEPKYTFSSRSDSASTASSDSRECRCALRRISESRRPRSASS
jgi:dolichol-phosphate mannosyltransferase